MRQRSLIAITAALAAGALTLTACGSRDAGSSNAGGSGTTVVIGVDAPLTGDLSALGLGIKNSADLAAKTANKKNYVDGITFKIKALDDQAQPSSGQQNATQARRRQRRPRRRRPPELLRRRVHAEGLRRRQTRRGLPRQHRPHPDPGPGLAERQKGPPVQVVLPHRNHRRRPGPLRRPVRLQRRQEEEGLRHRRQEDLRRRTRRHLHRRIQETRRQSRRHRTHRPRHQGLLRRRHQGEELRRGRRLLRRRIPPGRPAQQADQGRRRQDPASSAATASTDADFIELAGRTSTGDLATSVGAPVEELTSAKEFVANYKADGATRSPTPHTAATPTTPPGRSSRP